MKVDEDRGEREGDFTNNLNIFQIFSCNTIFYYILLFHSISKIFYI